MTFIRPTNVDPNDRDLWCIVIDGEECEPGTAQCPDCGHGPDAGPDEHAWDPIKGWVCRSCGLRKKIVPYSIEQ